MRFFFNECYETSHKDAGVKQKTKEMMNQSATNKGTMVRQNGLYGNIDQCMKTTSNQNLDMLELL